MEAYKEWWEEDGTIVIGNDDNDVAMSGWRASLEWLYGKLGYSEEHEELKDLIEKELED